LYYAATGELPWISESNELFHALENGFDFIPRCVPRAVAAILQLLIQEYPDARPSVSEFVADERFTLAVAEKLPALQRARGFDLGKSGSGIFRRKPPALQGHLLLSRFRSQETLQ